MSLIENLGDAHEALDECFHIIRALTGGDKERVNAVGRRLLFPGIKADMVEGGEDSLAESSQEEAPAQDGEVEDPEEIDCPDCGHSMVVPPFILAPVTLSCRCAACDGKFLAFL